jgi:hypothetical protein
MKRIPIDIAVIVAAWARGWTLDQIGFAAGVSRERVRQRLEVYENKHGPVMRFRRPSNINSPSRAWQCPGCGQTFWADLQSLQRAERRGEQHTCSIKCYVTLYRRVSKEMIERAIDMRWAGRPWGAIVAELGFTQQAIQTRIWGYLYEIGMLNTETVESIWDPQRGGHHHAWNWLERGTGLICTENGARLSAPMYGCKKSPWGVRIVRNSNAVSYPGTESQSRLARRQRLWRSKAYRQHIDEDASARAVEGGKVSD